MTRTIVVLATFLIGVGIGIGVGAIIPYFNIESLPQSTSRQVSKAQSSDSNKPSTNLSALEKQPSSTHLIPPDEQINFGFEGIKRTISRVEAMTRDELIEAISGFGQKDISSGNFYKATIYIERLLSIDPELAMAVLRGHRLFSYSWSTYLLSWAQQDLPSAMNYYDKLDGTNERSEAARGLLKVKGIEESPYLTSLLDELGELGPGLLLQAKLTQLPSDVAFEQALAFLDTGNADQSMMFEVMTRWLEDDFSAMFERLSTMENSSLRQSLMSMAIGSAPSNQGVDLLDLVSRYSQGDSHLLAQAIQKVAEEDPLKALPMAEALAKKSGTMKALQGVVGQWAKEDMTAAIAYVDGLSLSQRRQLYSRLAYRFARESPSDAFHWALSMKNEFEATTDQILTSVYREHPGLVEELLISYPEHDVQAKLQKIIWTSKGQANPGQAVRDYLSDGNNSVSDKMFSTLLGYWQSREPVMAAEFVSQAVLENPEMKNAGRNLSNWYSADPEAVTAWVESLPFGSQPRTEGYLSLVNILSQDSPVRAAEYLSDIPEGKAKESAANKVAHSWFRKAPESFEQMVEALELSEKAAKHMRKHQTGELE